MSSLVISTNSFAEMFENQDINAPWNDSLKQDDFLAPWNNDLYKDDITAPWNNFAAGQDETNEYLNSIGESNSDYYWH